METYAENRKARFDYEILDTYEAGVELRGFEVKAIKTGKANLTGAYVLIRNEQPFLINCDIPPYQPTNTPPDYNPTRQRRLLLNKKEVKELMGKTKESNLTIIPLKLYNKGGKIKLEIGLGRGRKKSDKRETIKQREWQRLRRKIETR